MVMSFNAYRLKHTIFRLNCHEPGYYELSFLLSIYRSKCLISLSHIISPFNYSKTKFIPFFICFLKSYRFKHALTLCVKGIDIGLDYLHALVLYVVTISMSAEIIIHTMQKFQIIWFIPIINLLTNIKVLILGK